MLIHDASIIKALDGLVKERSEVSERIIRAYYLIGKVGRQQGICMDHNSIRNSQRTVQGLLSSSKIDDGEFLFTIKTVECNVGV